MMDSKLLFADWYRETELNPTSQTIDARLKAIDSVTKKGDIKFWLDVLKLYLGYKATDVPSYMDFCNEFRKHDSSFPLQNNENLIHVLAASSICIRLESLISIENDALALAVLTSNFLGQFEIEINIPVFSIAIKYIDTEALNFRKIHEEDINDKKIEFTNVDVELDEDEVLDVTHLDEPLKAINEVISHLVAQMNTLSNEVINHKKINNNLLEEVNILWWVFGEQSILFNKRFKDVGLLPTIFVGAYELSGFITQSPGFVSTLPILDKILKLAHNKEKVYPNVSFNEIINSIPENIRKLQVKSEPENILVFTPGLLSLKKSLEVNEGEDWSTLFKRVSLGADSKRKKPALEVAEQIYRELQFINSYNMCI